MTPPTSTDEQLVDAFDTHWIKYIAPACIYLLVTAGGLLLVYISANIAADSLVLSQLCFFSSLVVILSAHHCFFYFLMSEGMIDAIVTNERLVYFHGLLWVSDDMHEISLQHIRGVEARVHGVFQNLFRYGDLWFDTGGASLESGSILKRVPKPHRRAKKIRKLLEEQ